MATDLLRDGEVQTAQGVLDAAGVTVPTGDLVGGVYDEGGEFYQLPEAVIADPENVVTDEGDGDGEERKGGLEADAEADGRDLNEEELERRREEKGKGVLKSGDLMRVKARLSDRGGPDVLVTLSKEQSVRVLVRKIQEEAGVSFPTLSSSFYSSLLPTCPDCLTSITFPHLLPNSCTNSPTPQVLPNSLFQVQIP